MTSRVSSTRRSLACTPRSSSAISSRKSVPPWAAWTYPSESAVAPEYAPFCAPNNSRSASASGMVAQLTATNGPSAPRLARWNNRAASSLPEPLSPVSTRVSPRRAARWILSQAARSEGPTTVESMRTTPPSRYGPTSRTKANKVRPRRTTRGLGANTSPTTRTPSRKVPLRLARSVTRNREPSHPTSAWRRDMRSSSRCTVRRSERPSTTPRSPSGNAWNAGVSPTAISSRPGRMTP